MFGHSRSPHAAVPAEEGLYESRSRLGTSIDDLFHLLVDLGFEWDSSGTAHDFRPYRLRRSPKTPVDDPYRRGEPTDIVEVPYIWHRDDWMQLFPVVSGPEWVAYSEEPAVFERWSTELDWLADHDPGGVYVLLLHPQCAGRAPFPEHLEVFLSELRGRDDIEFAEVSEVAASVER